MNGIEIKPKRQKVPGSGRVAGTPNKDKPLKIALREHSIDYFSLKREMRDKDGNIIVDSKGDPIMMTQYEMDLLMAKPSERINAELTLLKYHTPQMQATAVDVSASDSNSALADRLARLSKGEDIPSDLES